MNLVKRAIVILLIMILASMVILANATPANAQLPEVWVDNDWAGSSYGDPVDGHTFGVDAFATIQEGIDAVASLGTVYVAAGSYHESITLKDGVEVLGAGADVTTIHGGGAGPVVMATDIGPDTVLDGFLVTGGDHTWEGSGVYMRNSMLTISNNAFYDNTAWSGGGGIWMYDSSPTMTNNSFQNNTAWSDGGGIFMQNSSPTMTNNSFQDNNAANGGGIWMHGSSPTMTNNSFQGNRAEEGSGIWMENSSPTMTGNYFQGNNHATRGGGICMYSSSPTMTNDSFQGNTAGRGGGIWMDESQPTMTGNSFQSNTATDGGGIYMQNSSPTITDCIFSNNSASDGGGMCNASYSSPTVTNCTFSNNLAGDGGGMYNDFYSSPTVTNCTFSSNLGDGMQNWDFTSPMVTKCTFFNNSGTGIRNYPSCSPVITNCIFSSNLGHGIFSQYSSPTITSCTFFGNSGAGIFNLSSSPTITNCILWDNGEEIQNDASVPTVTCCDVQEGYSGLGNIDADPLFIDPAWGDYRLQAGSPCIDAGTNEGAPTEDMEGNPRPIDGDGDSTAITDMGAYEYVPPATLEVEISSPLGTETYSACQAFDLTFTITNSGWSDAMNVTATVDPGAAAKVEGQEQGVSWTTPMLGDIPGSGTIGPFTYDMHCTGSGISTIAVAPAGTDERTGEAITNITTDSVTISQETPAALEVEISSPVGTETYPTCQHFDLIFTIENSGEADALDVTVTVDPGATAEVEDEGQGVSWTTPILGDIPGGGTIGPFTYEMHCTGSGDSTITVTPMGEDENTGMAIADIIADSVTIRQETAPELPTITSVNPSHSNQSETLDVTIAGTNFTGATAVSFGAGVAVNSFSVDSPTQIIANITIDVTAATGSRDVSVTAPGGTETLTGGFTVEEKAAEDEVGGCECASVEGDISRTELLVGWGILGLCCGTGYCLVRMVSRRKAK